MTLLENIDKDGSRDINRQELEDALKPQGFLSKSENIQQLSIDLQRQEKDTIAQSLESTINTAVTSILDKPGLNDIDISILHLWENLFGPNEKYIQVKKSIENKINTTIISIGHRISKLIAANREPNKNHYTSSDIKAIQLRAGIHFGDNLAITGDRGNMFNLIKNNENQRKTNLYIYRLELEHRQDIIQERSSLGYSQIFENLLQTPNIENVLNTLPTVEQQDKVLEKFLSFFLKEVKQPGMFFENKIGGEALAILLIYLVQAEKHKNNGPLLAFYTSQIQQLQNNIKTTTGEITEQNNYTIINEKLQELTALSENDRDKKEQIFKQLTQLADKTNNSKLKDTIIIMISNIFSEQEIRTRFGEQSIIQLHNTREKISKKLSEHEEANDILSQIENRKIGKWSIQRASRTEYEKARPNDANANKKGLKGTLNDYNGGVGSGSFDYNNKDQHVPGDMYTINIPGGGSITVRIDYKDEFKIKNLLELGNKLDQNTYLVLPGYTKEFGVTGSGNSATGYNYYTMDQTEKDKNILDIDDFSIAKKQNNGDIALHKMTNHSQYNNTPYQIITKDKQDEAKSVQNLAISSSYTPESIGLYSDVGSIQTSMQDIQTLYNKMGAAKVDRGNIDALGVIFALSNPIGSPLLDTYIPVTGGIDEKDVNSIFTKAILMKNKVSELKEKKQSLIKIRDQIQQMASSIDKSKIVTNEEEKIFQALNAVNFLINGTREGGQFDQFIDFMTNPKYVSANGSFTELGTKWLKENGLKFILAIGVAVAVMASPLTGGMSLLGVAALGTIGGMAGSRLGQRANEGLQNSVFQKQITINGKVINIKYNDPTDIEMLLNGDLSPEDFSKSIGREFVVGTVSMYGFMKAGQILGKSLSKFVEANPTSKLSRVLKILKPEFAKVQDPYTQNIFDNIAKKGSEKGFFNKFAHEFGQEVGEEGMEGAADQSGIPGLAMLVTTWNSLTPGANTKLYSDNKVSIANIEKIDNNAIIEMNYNGDPNQLISHFISKGFTLDAEGNLSKKNDTIPNITDIIKLTPSTASIQTRSMENIFSQYNMTINHNATDLQGNHINEVIFPTDIEPTKLEEFKTNIEKSGKGVITTNSNGSFTLQTTQESIIFRKETIKNTNQDTNIDTDKSQQEFIKATEDVIQESDHILEEIKNGEVEIGKANDEYEKNVIMSKVLHKVQHYLHKIDTYLGGHGHHLIHTIKENTQQFKEAKTVIPKIGAVLNILASISYTGYEALHLFHNIEHMLHGTYTGDYHINAEAQATIATYMHEGINAFTERLVLLELRIKNHITLKSFGKDILELNTYRNDPDAYSAYIIKLSIKYNNIPINKIEEVNKMIKNKSDIDMDTHIDILTHITQDFSEIYYGTSDGALVNNIIEKAINRKEKIQNTKNAIQQ